MSRTMTRGEALELLYAADRLRAEAMLPTLSLQEREDKLGDLLEDDELPIPIEADDSADVALGIYRSEEEGWDYRLVRSEMPDDPGNPRFDKLIIQVLPGDRRYYGAANQYLSDELARIGHPDVTVTGEPELLLPCPCCGYRTLPRRGEYDICPVCFWEDTGNEEIDRYSGPNHMTLREGRQNYHVIGACDTASLEHVDRTPGKYVRAIDYSQG